MYIIPLVLLHANGLLLPAQPGPASLRRPVGRPARCTSSCLVTTVDSLFDADAHESSSDDADAKESFVLLSGRRRPASTINVAVLGSGSFGTAMASYLGSKGVNVTMVVRKAAVADSINENRVNPNRLSGMELPESVGACVEPALAFPDADFIFHTVPVQYSRSALTPIRHLIPPDVPIICLSKGIETGSLLFMSEVLEEVLGPEQPLAYLSGPSFAMEIAQVRFQRGLHHPRCMCSVTHHRLPPSRAANSFLLPALSQCCVRTGRAQGLATAVTIASHDRDLGNDVMSLLKSRQFRALYTSDVIGVEVGGAIKNVIAIAAGMCEGLGLGTNAMAALVTRGCAEMRRLSQTFGVRATPHSKLCLAPPQIDPCLVAGRGFDGLRPLWRGRHLWHMLWAALTEPHGWPAARVTQWCHKTVA